MELPFAIIEALLSSSTEQVVIPVSTDAAGPLQYRDFTLRTVSWVPTFFDELSGPIIPKVGEMVRVERRWCLVQDVIPGFPILLKVWTEEH